MEPVALWVLKYFGHSMGLEKCIDDLKAKVVRLVKENRELKARPK